MTTPDLLKIAALASKAARYSVTAFLGGCTVVHETYLEPRFWDLNAEEAFYRENLPYSRTLKDIFTVSYVAACVALMAADTTVPKSLEWIEPDRKARPSRLPQFRKVTHHVR